VVGSLNPGIVHPRWLLEQGIVDVPVDQWEVELSPMSRMVTFSNALFRWQCTPTRLTVSAVGDDANPGEAVGKLLGVLKHTPVQAVGNNFAYLIAPDAGAAAVERTHSASLVQLAEAGLECGLYQHTYVVAKNAAQLRITVDIADRAVHSVGLNFHRLVDGPTSARVAARAWSRDGHAAQQVLKGLLK